MGFFLKSTSKQTSKLKSQLKLTVARLATVRRPCRGRRSVARGDVGKLLALGHLDRALFRAEQVIEEDNMLEVFDIVELHCKTLIEQAAQLDKPKECSEAIKEAARGLMFAAARHGELPELLDARAILADKFGKEFAKAAKEGSGGVNPTLVRNLSGERISMERKKKLTKEIAEENDILLDFPEPPIKIAQGKQSQEAKNMSATKFDDLHEARVETYEGKQGFVNDGGNPSLAQLSMEERVMRESNKYSDARMAAEAAFESATFAAMAARAAVELSRSETQGKGGRSYDRVHPVRNSAATEQETPSRKPRKSSSPSSSWSDASTVTLAGTDAAQKGKCIVFDQSDEEPDEVADEIICTPPLARPPYRRTASATGAGSTHGAWHEESRKVGSDPRPFYGGVSESMPGARPPYRRNATAHDESLNQGSLHKSPGYVHSPYRRQATASGDNNGNVARHEELDDDRPCQDGGVYESSAYVRSPYRRIVSALERGNEQIARHEEVHKIGTDARLFQETVYGVSNSDGPGHRALNPERRAASVRTRR